MSTARHAAPPTLPAVGVVLSGGGSTRMGADKATTEINGTTMLQMVLDGFVGIPVIVVGPPAACAHVDVRFVREDPPGGGPCAALVAGAAAAHAMGASIIAVVATDMPGAAAVAREAAARLAELDAEIDAVVPSDEEERPQPLCAAYRVAAVADWALGWGNVTGASVRSLTGTLTVESWRPADVGDALLDIDDNDALERARAGRDREAH